MSQEYPTLHEHRFNDAEKKEHEQNGLLLDILNRMHSLGLEQVGATITESDFVKLLAEIFLRINQYNQRCAIKTSLTKEEIPIIGSETRFTVRGKKIDLQLCLANRNSYGLHFRVPGSGFYSHFVTLAEAACAQVGVDILHLF